MRLFLTSYMKSGTHQALQMIMHGVENIVDRADMLNYGLEDYWHKVWEDHQLVEKPIKHPECKRPFPRMVETLNALESFPSKAFGHIPYLPEYAEALRTQPTKVLFNIRDPRDVIVSEYMNLKRNHKKSMQNIGHLNLLLPNGIYLYKSPDPIAELIKLSPILWANWYGWLDEDFTVVLKYEDLRLRSKTTIKELVKSLGGCNLPSPDIMEAQAKDTDWSTTFRKGLVSEWKLIFTPKHRVMADELLQPVLDRLGYNGRDQ